MTQPPPPPPNQPPPAPGRPPQPGVFGPPQPPRTRRPRTPPRRTSPQAPSPGPRPQDARRSRPRRASVEGPGAAAPAGAPPPARLRPAHAPGRAGGSPAPRTPPAAGPPQPPGPGYGYPQAPRRPSRPRRRPSPRLRLPRPPGPGYGHPQYAPPQPYRYPGQQQPNPYGQPQTTPTASRRATATRASPASRRSPVRLPGAADHADAAAGAGSGGRRRQEVQRQMPIIVAAVVAIALIVGGGVWYATSGRRRRQEGRAASSAAARAAGDDGDRAAAPAASTVRRQGEGAGRPQVQGPLPGARSPRSAGRPPTRHGLLAHRQGVREDRRRRDRRLRPGQGHQALDDPAARPGLRGLPAHHRRTTRRRSSSRRASRQGRALPAAATRSRRSTSTPASSCGRKSRRRSGGDGRSRSTRSRVSGEHGRRGRHRAAAPPSTSTTGKPLWTPKPADSCYDAGYGGGDEAGRGPQVRHVRQPASCTSRRSTRRPGSAALRVQDADRHRVREHRLHQAAGRRRRRRRHRRRRQRHLGLLLHRRQDRQAAHQDLGAGRQVRGPLRRLTEVEACSELAVGNDRLYVPTEEHDGSGEYGTTNEIVAFDLATGKQTGQRGGRGRRLHDLFPLRMDGANVIAYKGPPVRQGRPDRLHRRRHVQGDRAAGEPGRRRRCATRRPACPRTLRDPLLATGRLFMSAVTRSSKPGSAGRQGVPGGRRSAPA